MVSALTRKPFLISALLFSFVCNFLLYFLFYNNRENSCVCEQDCVPTIVADTSSNTGKKYPEFLKANEEIRARFLAKRDKNLIASRSLNNIALWEHISGWQYVWNHFPPVFTCPHLIERIGTAKDGGKWICGISIFEETKTSPCVIYSLGVGWDSTFEVEMLERTACSVYAYDYTVNKMELPSNLAPELKSRIHFFKLGLGSKKQAENDDRFRTLGQLMKQNGHDWIDFLKVDIEGAEFELLTEMNEEFHNLPYGHLNIEIHLDEKATLSETGIQMKEFKKLYDFWESLENSGLRAWMWEDNYYMCTFGKAPPVVMEYALINVRNTEKNRLIQF